MHPAQQPVWLILRVSEHGLFSVQRQFSANEAAQAAAEHAELSQSIEADYYLVQVIIKHPAPYERRHAGNT